MGVSGGVSLWVVLCCADSGGSRAIRKSLEMPDLSGWLFELGEEN